MLLVFFSRKWCYGIRVLCSKNDINQKFWTHFIFHKCNDVWPSKEPRRLRSRFIGIWKVCIHLVASFLSSKVFYPRLFLTRTRRTTYIYHALWKKRSNIRNHWTAIFHVHELYSINQIPSPTRSLYNGE